MTLITDNFNRADVNPLDGNWQSIGAQNVRLITGGGGEHAIQHTNNAQLAQYRSSLDLASSHHYSQVGFDFIQTPTGNTAFFEVTARGNASDNACYVGGYSITTAGVVTAYIGRRDSGGTLTVLTSAGGTIATTDSIYLSAILTALLFKKNGTTVLSTTDGTITTGLRPGFVYLAGIEPYDFEADDFEAQDLTVPATGLPPLIFHPLQA